MGMRPSAIEALMASPAVRAASPAVRSWLSSVLARGETAKGRPVPVPEEGEEAAARSAKLKVTNPRRNS